jgi:hypothetical protein
VVAISVVALKDKLQDSSANRAAVEMNAKGKSYIPV